MRLLSNRRRHPLLRTMVLAMALFVFGLLYAVAVPAGQSSADDGMSTQVEEGRALYQVGCSSCHGLNAEGSSQGPPLAGTGSAAVDFQMQTGRMPAKAPGAQIPVKPKNYSDAEIAAIGAYIDSLGPGITIPEPSQYDADTLEYEQSTATDPQVRARENQAARERAIARGGELFRTNCSACHNFTGLGGALPDGKYAPSLIGVSDKHIWEAMRTGPQQMPVFAQDTITDDDAKAIIAYLDSVHSQPNQGGLALGGFGPVSEGLWAWLIGIGGLVAFAVWIAAKGARVK